MKIRHPTATLNLSTIIHPRIAKTAIRCWTSMLARPTANNIRQLREALADYMTTPDDAEPVYPPDRLVVDVMDAAGGATEEEVIQCLRYLKDERGLRPGTRLGPRRFAWFKSAVPDYFRQKRNREMVYAPPEVDWDRRNGQSPSREELDSMTDAIEVPGF
jgi:hypothetical protein